jgi:hypothetical protein
MHLSSGRASNTDASSYFWPATMALLVQRNTL